MKQVIDKGNDQWEIIGTGEQTVYQMNSLLKRGVATSGKTWARFQRESMRVFSWKRGGRMRFYHMGRNRGYGQFRRSYFYDQTGWVIQNSLQTHNGRWSPAPDPLMLALEEHVGMSRRSLILKEYPLALDIPVARGITAHLAHPTVAEFTRSYFGERYTRKDVIRGVAQRGWLSAGGTDRLVTMKAFLPLVPIDWVADHLNDLPAPSIYDFMSDGMAPAAQPYSGDFTFIRRMLRTATPKQTRQLFRDLNRAKTYSIADSLRSFADIRSIDPTYRLESLHFANWSDLHDLLPREARKLQTMNRDIAWSDLARKLEGTRGEYSIELPKDTHTLIDWGQRMNNCIGGYADQAVAGQTLLYAVRKDGELVANMEITSKGDRIQQLVGKHNTYPDRPLESAIRAWVHEVFPMNKDDDGLGLADWERELLEVQPFGAGEINAVAQAGEF